MIDSVFVNLTSEMVIATHKLFTLLRKLGATGTVHTSVKGGALISRYSITIDGYDPQKNMGPSPEELLSRMRFNNLIFESLASED